MPLAPPLASQEDTGLNLYHSERLKGSCKVNYLKYFLAPKTEISCMSFKLQGNG